MKKQQLIEIAQLVKAEYGSCSNEALREFYGVEDLELKTFKGWKEAGYSVKKGEKAYGFWSAPIKSKVKEEEVESSEESSDEEKAYRFFNVCNLFSEDQVEKIQ